MPLNSEFQAVLASIVRPIYAADLPDNLDMMRHWLEQLGLSKPAYPIIAVAGSVGKGSAALSLAHHFSKVYRRVGLYTSPHLHSFRERFQIDGEMISQKSFAFHASKVIALTQKDTLQPSTFEAATLIAFGWFAAEQIDLAICEIGMGGRFDAVNALPNQLAVFTPVELEHVAALGGTLETIAWHKIGILQPEGTGISLPQSPPAQRVFKQEAALLGAALIEASDLPDMLKQADRVITARQPAAEQTIPPRWGKQLPGRMEIFRANDHTFILDGAHTASSAARLRAYLNTLEQPILLIAALLRDKSAAAILRSFDAPQFRVVLAPLAGHRGAAPGELLNVWQPEYAKVESVESVQTAISTAAFAPEPVIAVCGSLRTVALARETLGLLSADALAESHFTRALFENDTYLRKIR